MIVGCIIRIVADCRAAIVLIRNAWLPKRDGWLSVVGSRNRLAIETSHANYRHECQECDVLVRHTAPVGEPCSANFPPSYGGLQPHATKNASCGEIGVRSAAWQSARGPAGGQFDALMYHVTRTEHANSITTIPAKRRIYASFFP